MASLAPRVAGFRSSPRMPLNHFAEDEEQQACKDDRRTPLDRTIDRIGMGCYQWTLLSLCGFGWMADNMWIQAVAIVLPRVQQHYSVPDNYIGAVSSFMFAGMMIGAVGWGTCSDLLGRSTAFNATLFFTSLFGLLTLFANSFSTLCVILFFLGSAVGGSMPTDGTLLLEHMPEGKKYLVTALSIFFSFGAVLASVVALAVMPQNSCPAQLPCNVETQNQGWKYLLVALGLITLTMFLGRMVFFRLHESPRYLVHAGRPEEAIKSLQMISRFNGSDIAIELEDVADHYLSPAISCPVPDTHNRELDDDRLRANSKTVIVASVIEDGPQHTHTHQSGSDSAESSKQTLVTQYASTGESPVLEHRASAAASLYLDTEIPSREAQNPVQEIHDDIESETSEFISRSLGTSTYNAVSSASSGCERQARRFLPRCLRKPLSAWLDRIAIVLSPEWFRVTILIWMIWGSMSLAYTMFNVFLPKLLEARNMPSASQTLEDSLWDIVIFTIGGCPGALLGAYLTESSLGRRWSLAGSTFVTAIFIAMFIMVDSSVAIRASTVGISLSSTAMWAVLYGWTPEIFETKVRGTACGIASALSRIGGMIAPMLGGFLLMKDRSLPVYTSIIVFTIAGCCTLLLREKGGGSGKRQGGASIMH